MFWGTGVGGGIVLDGRPWTGRGAGGEIGHVVVRIGGERCGCGRLGCMEAYAGRASMERRAREAHKKGEKTDLFKIMEQRGRDRLASGVWDRALRRNDRAGDQLVDEASRRSAPASPRPRTSSTSRRSSSAAASASASATPTRSASREAMLPHLFDDINPPAMHVAALGDLGGAIGAALLAQPASGRPV